VILGLGEGLHLCFSTRRWIFVSERSQIRQTPKSKKSRVPFSAPASLVWTYRTE
jgi:hypothetical protein